MKSSSKFPLSSLTLLSGLVLVASCTVDTAGLTFDDDEYLKVSGKGQAAGAPADDESSTSTGGRESLGDGGASGGSDSMPLGGASTGGEGAADGDGGGDGGGGQSDDDEGKPKSGDTRCNELQVEYFVGGSLWAPLGSPCEFLCVEGECTGSCVPDAVECVSATEARTCSGEGKWESDLCEFACVDDACGGDCVPGHRRCLGNQKQLCDEAGQWVDDGEECPGTCEDSGDGESAACIGNCSVEAATQCVDTKNLQVCSSNQWTTHSDSPCDFVCLEGACRGVCEPQATRCVDNAKETCTSVGEWGKGVSCTGQACVGGACTGVCEPNTKRCSNNGVQTCSSTGTWGTSSSCTNQACIDGACTGVCTPQTTRCVDNGVQTCTAEGTWGISDDCAGQACVKGACTGVCEPNTKRCSNNGVQTCSAAGSWGTASACSGQACVDGACTGECKPETTRCVNNAVETCSSVGEWGTGSDCGEKFCLGGACSGECKPDSERCNPDTGNIEVCDGTGQWTLSRDCKKLGYSCVWYDKGHESVPVCGECSPSDVERVARCRTVNKAPAVDSCYFNSEKEIATWVFEAACATGRYSEYCYEGVCAAPEKLCKMSSSAHGCASSYEAWSCTTEGTVTTRTCGITSAWQCPYDTCVNTDRGSF